MAIKFTANGSAGIPFGIDETRTVALANEALDISSGFEGDPIVYTVTIDDNTGVALPASFVVDLKINGTDLIAGQALDVTVYDPVTKLLTLPWAVPAIVGTFTVTLEWAEQVI